MGVGQYSQTRVLSHVAGSVPLLLLTHVTGPPARHVAMCRCVVMHTPSEGLPALQVVGRVLAEQAALFYATDAQVRLLRVTSGC